jgi:class 3 adenylate cyclase
MEAPPIQYCKTKDGVSIAFWRLGAGPPLVILPNLIAGHVQLDWESESLQAGYERLAERAIVIRFDCRGLGLSQSDRLDLSAAAQALDLEAVVDHLGLKRFALYGSRASGEVLFDYPGSRPERVSHLIVSVPPLHPDIQRHLPAIRPLMEEHWDLFTEIWARLIMGWDEQRASLAAKRIREAHTPSSFESVLGAAASSRGILMAAIRAPTLILHGLGSEQASLTARELAAGIAGAHLVGIPNWPLATTFNETVVAAVLEFINTRTAALGTPIAPPQIDISAVRTIVFTDVEGSTALNERLGDEGAREVLREHERLTREALAAHGGSEVKAMGDGFMAWFPSATRAVECAIALQRAFAERNASLPAHPEALEGRAERQPPAHGSRTSPRADRSIGAMSASEPIRVRIGINAGEPIAEGDDLFGASIITTARIAAAARGDQILASDVVRQLLAGKGFVFTERGEHALKGFDEPVRLYEVRWRE